ncbi:MAG: aldehyde dehydrogenase [Proteobacteria bacterium]|nr:MAG: aldehyde dehydrogenase [Pseudomonadota bacterium]
MDDARRPSIHARLKRREVVPALLENRGDLLVVTGLGSSCYDVAAAGDHPRNFYLWGAMGSAAMIGLGLALAQPKQRVLVVTGDGEMLMGLGSLATIAVQRPSNLTIAVLDNGVYSETGMQRSHTSDATSLRAVAAGCGISTVLDVVTMQEVAGLRDLAHRADGPVFAAIHVSPEEDPRVLPSRDGVYLKLRFREQLGMK